eukprot:jgi/Astpho2/8320/Aster-01392
MQQHVDYWDFDNDGIIYPLDTFKGFRLQGAPVWMATFAVPFIHGSFSYATQPGWLPDPFFSIHTDRIHKQDTATAESWWPLRRCKHGSDSETYDTEGRYVVEKFEELWTKYAKGKDYMSLEELWNMTEGNRNLLDPTGWTAEKLEWLATIYLYGEKRGKDMSPGLPGYIPGKDKVLTKETARTAFDGTLFPATEAALKQKKLGSKKHN